MSTTAVSSPILRTSIVMAGALISGVPPLVTLHEVLVSRPLRGRSGELADGVVEVGKELDEVRQPGDVEDLAVVRGQPAGDDLAAFGPGAGQDADNQRDAGGADVVHRREVEHYRTEARVGADGRVIRVGQHVSGGSVDLAGKLYDGGAGQHPGRGLTHARHVQHLQFAWSARWCGAGRWLLCPWRRPCCGSGTGPSHAGSGRRRAS